MAVVGGVHAKRIRQADGCAAVPLLRIVRDIQYENAMVQSSVIAAKLCRTAGQIISLDSVFLRLICSLGGGCSLSG